MFIQLLEIETFKDNNLATDEDDGSLYFIILYLNVLKSCQSLLNYNLYEKDVDDFKLA